MIVNYLILQHYFVNYQQQVLFPGVLKLPLLHMWYGRVHF